MYPKRLNNKESQRGVGLPATVFLIVIIALIVLALGELNQKSNLGFGQDLFSMRAFYAAESGAQVALNRVFVGVQACTAGMTNIDFDSGSANPGLDQCEVVVDCGQTLINTTTFYTFSSTATCGSGFEQAQRRIEVRAKE
jgi:MSHA biogenesis protein MshP